MCFNFGCYCWFVLGLLVTLFLWVADDWFDLDTPIVLHLYFGFFVLLGLLLWMCFVLFVDCMFVRYCIGVVILFNLAGCGFDCLLSFVCFCFV